MRTDARPNDQLRPVTITRNFTATPAASVLWQQGKTIVLCTASISAELPPWFRPDRPGGWITAEYVMLPASTPQRKAWPKIGHTDSRGTEIQRLIGRSLRAIIDLSKIGPHTIAIDCQVLQADGGTRTAAICGAYLALADAIAKLPAQFPTPKGPEGTASAAANKPSVANTASPAAVAVLGSPAAIPARYDPAYYKPAEALVGQLAAVSVGVVDGEVRLDLDYADDSRAQVDFNVAYTKAGRFVEIQGSAENGLGFDRRQMDQMLDLAVKGCRELMEIQERARG